MENPSCPPPTITVIIPTYNWSSVLPYSIGSVLGQTRSDWELWVIGDGCTDDSAAVVGQFTDPRIHWHNLPQNVGQQGGPNNKGLELSRGQYIAYLGHDDVWMPYHLELLGAALDQGADVAYGWICGVRADARRYVLPTRSYHRGDWLPPTGLMHRKSLVEKAGHWKLPDELDRDPEVDFLKRLNEAGATFQEIRRLTAIKFPAAMRRNVYQHRPSHEQAEGLKRILGNPDLEKEELIAILSENRQPQRISFQKDLKLRFSAWIRRRLSYKRGTFAKRRKFKGLPYK